MREDILRNLSSQFDNPTDGPYPPVVDILSDPPSELPSNLVVQAGDVAMTEADNAPRAADGEGDDSSESASEPSFQVFEESPSTDSGVSLIVNLGTERYDG